MNLTGDSGASQIQLDEFPKRVSNYSLEELDGELLLYHPTRSTILYLNKTASVVWSLCDGNYTVEQIIELISDAFCQDPEDISADVNSTLSKFIEAGSIEMSKESQA